MPKVPMGYVTCRAFWRCFCVLAAMHSIGFSYLSQTMRAQNGLVEMQVTIPEGLSSWKMVTAYKGGSPIREPAWFYVAGFFGFEGSTPACGDSSHRTSAGRTYQHAHIGKDFPIYDASGVEITIAMVKEGWKRFFTARYGANQFLMGGEPTLTYNCHSFSTETTSHWNELVHTKMADDFQLAYFHHLTTCFALEQGTIGGFGHSLKFYFYNVGPSGTGVLATEEKYRESHFFMHLWPITDQNSPPAGTTGPVWSRGVKYKPK